ncbi:hypothetical protein FXV83_36885 [Bradyrhizobium hipponense]|uniref:Uncharacterized protein n=1 Tax=Bradyrhizobium hipponense TaxID=2605638 RepID=A0A5S4YMW7_9BRAD|nr:hypothetical protein FXV83_36885 [Bradyrhizobium hipponense]
MDLRVAPHRVPARSDVAGVRLTACVPDQQHCLRSMLSETCRTRESKTHCFSSV